jgi:predicted DNA repair protein MutK
VEASLLERLGVLAWFHIGGEIFEHGLSHFDGVLTYLAHMLRHSPIYYYSMLEMRVPFFFGGG